jgi:cardiolipin synthase
MDTRAKLGLVTLLTFARVPLVLAFFVGAIIYEKCPSDWLFTITFTCLITSAITDFFDGYLARLFKVTTKFGAHADPLMDKFFYLATFPLLIFVSARNNHITHATVLLVLTMLFLSRDQWVTFLRSIGAMYNVSGKASWAGKLRTAITFPLLCVIYHFEEAPAYYNFLSGWFVYTFEAVALFVNTLSLCIYTKKYWPYLLKSAEVDNEDQ